MDNILMWILGAMFVAVLVLLYAIAKSPEPDSPGCQNKGDGDEGEETE